MRRAYLPRMSGSQRPRAPIIALLYGAVCHGVFSLAGAAMVLGLYTGLTGTWGRVPWPWAAAANAALALQFPLAHSFLLTGRGRAILRAFAPAALGRTLETTVYATIASAQLLALFTLWTPSGVVLWRAEGAAFWVMSGLFAASWALLTKASFDAGAAVQSGSLGWTALARGVPPRFPPMPERGLFRLVRQPIYLAFALVLWTPPVWTADQVALASVWTLYCVLAPRLKERRFARLFGARFEAYRARTPYMLPRIGRSRAAGPAE